MYKIGEMFVVFGCGFF